MKKTSILFSAILGFLFLFTACEQQEEEEWTRFYDYTKADIIGHYEANPDESFYPEYPTEGVVFYKNAVVDIQDLSGDMISLRVYIPDVTTKVYTGVVDNQESTAEIILTNHSAGNDILLTVYKNKDQQIRLHGRDRHCVQDSEGVLDCDFNGIEVIKN